MATSDSVPAADTVRNQVRTSPTAYTYINANSDFYAYSKPHSDANSNPLPYGQMRTYSKATDDSWRRDRKLAR